MDNFIKQAFEVVLVLGLVFTGMSLLAGIGFLLKEVKDWIQDNIKVWLERF